MDTRQNLRFIMHREKGENEAQMVKWSQPTADLVFFLLKIWTTYIRNVVCQLTNRDHSSYGQES